MNNTGYHLFGGEHAYCLPGMDGYVGKYDDIEHAMKVAANACYDWSHIVEATALELKIVQVGRYNPGLKTMVWQADVGPAKIRDRYIKTFCSVMRSGVLLIGKLSCTRDRIPHSRMVIMTNALSLYDDIQSELGSMPTDVANSSIHLARQVIGQMIECMRRVQLSHKEKLEWNRWLNNASVLLDSTKDMQLFEDRWEKI